VNAPEYRAACARLGVHPLAFAEIVGAKGRPGWARPKASGAIPPAVASLVRIAEAAAAHLPYADLAKLLRLEAARLAAL
jgi:hypothetical protein